MSARIAYINTKVNWGERISTPKEMIELGLAKIVTVDNWLPRGGKKLRKATFVELTNLSGFCVEIHSNQGGKLGKHSRI